MTVVLVLAACTTTAALTVAAAIHPRRDLWADARQAPAVGRVSDWTARAALTRLDAHRRARPLRWHPSPHATPRF